MLIAIGLYREVRKSKSRKAISEVVSLCIRYSMLKRVQVNTQEILTDLDGTRRSCSSWLMDAVVGYVRLYLCIGCNMLVMPVLCNFVLIAAL
jgi:hypothetical protein